MTKPSILLEQYGGKKVRFELQGKRYEGIVIGADNCPMIAVGASHPPEGDYLHIKWQPQPKHHYSETIFRLVEQVEVL